MPSQEDNLDDLLKELESDVADLDLGDIPLFDQDDLTQMSEEEINKLLHENQNSAQAAPVMQPEGDLLQMLENGADASDDLKDIHDMLRKSEQNEAVNDDIVSLLNEAENPKEVDIMADAELSPKELKKKQAEEKKRQREEKKKEKLAKKLEKKQEKQQEKEGKTAKKPAGGLFGKKAEEKPAAEEIPKPVEEAPAALEEAQPEEPKEMTASEIEELFAQEVAAQKAAKEGKNKPGGTDEIFDNMAGLDQDLFKELDASVEEMGELTPEKVKEQAQEQERQKKAEKLEKSGLLGKVMHFLLDEEDEEESGEILLSQENEEVLRQLDSEEGKKGKRKKKKEKGKGKEKEKKAEAQTEEEAEEEPQDKKKKKEKKPKKEKAPKLKAADEKSEKKLPLKKVAFVFMICFSLAAAVLVLGNIGMDYSDKKSAKQAFDDGNYETCYQNLTGKYLNESQKIMYGKSESILRIRVWLKEYEILAQEGDELRALDSLLQSVHDYPRLFAFSEQYYAQGEIQETYAVILGILQDKYHLSKEQAQEIAFEADDIEYTKQVKNVLAGAAIEQKEPAKPQESTGLRDVLPEEADLQEDIYFQKES